VRIQKLPIPAMALAMTIPLLASSAFTQAAEDVKPATATNAPTMPSSQDQALRQFSQAGHSALLGIRDARFAIFNGQPKIAMKLMASAKTSLTQGEKDAPVFETSSKEMVGGKTVEMTSESHKIKRVPVDGQLALADDFVMTPEKQAHVDKANEHFKKGDQAKGLEELKLGEIDVNYTRLWMPIAPAEKHLDQAIKLADEGKYYEANLALKAIEDSMTVDSVTFSELPKSGGTARKP
jgi:hypothetical protein